MFVVSFVHLQVLFELSEEGLKLLYFLPIVEFLSHELLGELLNIWRLHLLINEGKILLVEFKVALDKFHKEEVVVIDKGRYPAFGLHCGRLRVALVRDLVSQIINDFLERFEVGNVLGECGLGGRI